MSNSTIIIDYLGSGTFANRPATPPIASSATSFYFATDTVVLYIWNGAAWVIVGSGTGGGGGGGGVTYEWNDLDSWASAVFVHGSDGRTVTGMSNGSGSVRAVQSRNSGKYYFEFLCGGVASNNSPAIGIGDANEDLRQLCGFGANAWSIFMNGTLYHNNTFGSVNTSFAIGDIVGIAVDFTAATGSFKTYKNNTLQANSYGSLTLGTMFPMVGIGSATSTVQGRGKLSLKAAEQTYAPPAGYSSWL